MKAFVLFCFLPFFLFAGPNQGSLMLMNDSTYILTAIITASDGSPLGQISLQPGQQRNFTTNLSPSSFQTPGRPDISLTPYTVIWQCPSEGIYSRCSYVQPGSYVRASACEGNFFCSPKESQTKAQPSSKVQKKQD
jgi:hypothetical protein